MGRTQAEGYASMKGKDKDLGLLAHLQGNHYPPVPASMLGPSKRAISAVNRGKHDSQIKLPEGVTWRGKTSAPANAIVDAHHLHAWLKDNDEY